jgi:hypothetical protein
MFKGRSGRGYVKRKGEGGQLLEEMDTIDRIRKGTVSTERPRKYRKRILRSKLSKKTKHEIRLKKCSENVAN